MNINKYLRYGVLGGIFLIPFIALYVSNSLFFPFITGKNFAFRIIVEIIVAAWIILFLRDEKFFPRKSNLLWSIVVFVGLLAISDVFFSSNSYKSIWSNFERMEGWITLIHLLGYFLVTSTMLRVEKLWFWFAYTELGASFLLTCYALLQLTGTFAVHQGATRLDATLGNSAYLAVYMIFNIFLALFLLVRYIKQNYGTNNWKLPLPIAYKILILLQLVVVYYTATRGAIIGIFIAILGIAIYFAVAEKATPILRKAGISLIVVLVLVAGSLIAFKNTHFVKSSQVLSRFTSLVTTDVKTLASTEAKSRFTIWPMAIRGSLEKPIFGWGQESFNYLFYKHYSPEMYDQEPWFDRAHNAVLDWLVAGGILGLIAYLSMFFFAIKALWKKTGNLLSNAERVVITGLFAAYFIHNLFVFDNIVSYIMFFGVMAAIHAFSSEEISPEKAALFIKNRESINYIAVPVVCVIAVIALYLVNIKGIMAASDLTQAVSPQTEGVSKNLDYFKKTLALDTFGTTEAREHLAIQSVQGAGVNFDPTLKSQMYNLAYSELKKQTEATPGDLRYQFFMANLLTSYGNNQEALSYAQKGVEISPKKQMMYFVLGNIYINLKQYDKAFAALKTAYDLEPKYQEAQVIYGLAAVYTKQDDLAKQLLEPVYGTTVIAEPRFMKAYEDLGQFAKLEKIWKDVLKLDAKNTQAHLGLTAVYLKEGANTAAIAEIQKVMDYDPAFKDQGTYYINEIKAGRNPAQ